ncbi:MAG: IGHMBP2 family helicase [Halanaerobacter sp.]
MSEIIIRGLKDHIGPGDIVGALTNEANINGNKIGNIDFKDKIALVEIEDGIADKVVEIMDNNQIAGVRVEIDLDDQFRDKLDRVKSYLNKYQGLVELEREEEMRRHEREIEYLSGYEREEKGRAILHLRGRDEGQALAGKFLVKFMRHHKGEKLPENEISIGDLVMLSKNEPLNDDNPTGTVIEQTNYSITVAFDSQPVGFVYGKGLRMDLYVNDITFQRMLDALDKLHKADGRLEELKDKLLGFSKPSFGQEVEVEFFNQDLNQSQRGTVKSALAAQDFFLVHGPPGTGKTTTAIEILEQEIEAEKSILATADSNTAVDNLVELLVAEDREVLRVGHPVRVNPLLREHTLDYLIEDHFKYQKAVKLREEAYELLDKQDEHTHPSGKWRRGMSNEQIKSLAADGKSSRGVPAEKIEDMAQWLKLQDRIDNLFSQIERLEDEAVAELIAEADVVCSTNSTAGSEVLDQQEFDLLVIDEATQATEPSALIPLTKAEKIVLAGDHKQLPPTILNEEAKKQGLAKSLFERLLEVHGAEIKEVLNLQYRMNQDIMNFSNHKFYDAQLKAAPEVKDWQLSDLEIDLPEGDSPTEQVLSCAEVIAFLDTCGMEVTEQYKKDSTSVQNQLEAELVAEIVTQIIRTGIDLTKTAVITPYKDQVELINRLIKEEEIEVDTVDGFQGREKEIIILSLVRSNEGQNIGFLKDIRRLNVSLTRAKKKLIIIGDSQTITSHQVYQDLAKYAKEKGFYYEL